MAEEQAQQVKVDIPPVLEEAVKDTLVTLLLKNLGKAFKWLRKR